MSGQDFCSMLTMPLNQHNILHLELYVKGGTSLVFHSMILRPCSLLVPALAESFEKILFIESIFFSEMNSLLFWLILLGEFHGTRYIQNLSYQMFENQS